VTGPDLRAVLSSAPISAVLIAINVALFAAVTVDAHLLDVLALPPSWTEVTEQPWTVLTACFTSAVFIHIAVAVAAIGLFGVRFERHAGSAHVLVVYLLAGLGGSLALLATAAAAGVTDSSVGASAAFLGLAGALATSPRDTWWDRLPLDKVVVVVLVIQVAAPALGIGDWSSSAAHTAGLGIGAAYGYLLRTQSGSEVPDAQSSTR